MVAMKYDPLTRFLHLCLAIGITAEMLTSLVMVDPEPGRPPNWWFEVHETLGVALLGVLVAHWLWSLGRSLASGAAFMLFPWFSAARLRALVGDARDTLAQVGQGRLPDDDQPRPLPAAVQGLGLLLATVLAATGTVMWVGMAPDGAMTGLVHGFKEVHEAVAPLMWAYLVLHPAMGILHQVAGHRTISRMFGRG
jgi:cytochrome b561